MSPCNGIFIRNYILGRSFRLHFIFFSYEIFSIQGRWCRYAFGSLMAFLSGLTITVNNFIVKATRVNFGEILAIRAIVQIPIMACVVFIKGR